MGIYKDGKLEHRFYSKNKTEQNLVQIRVALAAFAVISLPTILAIKTGTYLPLFIIIPIVLSLIASFFDVPSLKNRGKLTYFSLLFLAEMPNKGRTIIHGGTLFDYVFVFDRKMSGQQRTEFVVQQYLEGILNLISAYEKQWPGNHIISGTSYILNERTAERLGFKVVKTDLIQKFILTFNYFNLMVTHSLAKGKPSFPKLKETKTYEAKLEELMEQKETIMALNDKLKRTNSNKGPKTSKPCISY